MTLGQHYGLKTPFLDWSESPFVAAFFALAKNLQGKNWKRAVYALSESKVVSKSKELDKRNTKAEAQAMQAAEDTGQAGWVVVPTISFVRPCTDDNPRLVSQRGLFTSSGGIDIEKWVRRYFEGTDEAVLVRIWLPEEGREEFLKALNKIDINRLPVSLCLRRQT